MTEKRQETEKNLQEAHLRLLTILDSINALVYVADMDTYEVLFVNKYGKDTWGDITGKTCWKSLQSGNTGPCEFCTNKYLVDNNGNIKETYTWEFQNTVNGRWYYINDKAIHWIDQRIVRLEIATDVTERKQAEEKLQASEARYRSLFENMRNGFALHEVIVDDKNKPIDYVFLEINDAFESLMGLKRENVLGRRVTEVIPGIEKSEFDWIGKYGKIALEQGMLKFEQYSEALNKYFSITAYSPKKGYFAAIFDDITELKKAELVLRESKRKYKDLQDASIDGHAWTDMEGHLIEVNDSYKNMMGYSKDELRKLTYNDITPEKWHASEQIILTEQILARGYSDPYEKELIRKDGTIFPVELRAYLIKDTEGNNKGMRAVVKDITERKQAEIRLKNSEKRYRELFRNMSSGVAIYSAEKEGEDFIFKDMNAAGARLTNTDIKDVIGRKVTEAFPGVKEFGLFDKFQKVWKSGTPEYHPINLYKDEKLALWFENYIYKLPTGDIVAIFDDITKRKQAEEALQQLNDELDQRVKERTKELEEAQEQLVRKEKLAAIGELAGSISHELRNPLGVIGNSAYYLDMKFKDEDEKVKKHLNILQREIKRSNTIISDLLDFSRVSLTSLDEIDVNDIVENVLADIKISENINLGPRLNESLPKINADPFQIQQVFQNIISNAVQAMPEGGGLEITTGTKAGFIEIVFKDTGGGIPDENLRKIFEPLFTTKAKGIGLGLAIVKSIIDRHKGEIEVESEVGQGTVFTVKLAIMGGQKKI